ncbi:RHS repeat-associated core domain-containing protein, partial [Streptomyces dysideae]|uniref:RHS repeat-associated core domain-containing protein n=1 Tax=Streptomyces dysideae TaxID=909626 RepID=UPI00131BFD77
DDDTGLTHIGAREYDASIGRFISIDPKLTLDQHQSLNGYSYANNNPVTYADPTGLEVGSRPNSCQYSLANCSKKVQKSVGYNPSTGLADPAKATKSGTASIISTGSLFGDTDLATPGPYFDPKWAEDPVVMAWATSNQKGPLANALFGVGMPIAGALDIIGALFTPACIVEDQCLADRYRAWGAEHGF